MYGDCFGKFHGGVVLGGCDHHLHKLVVLDVEVYIHQVVFIQGCQCDRLGRSVYIVTDIVTGSGDPSVERGADIAIAQIGPGGVQSGFRITYGGFHFGYGRLGLQDLDLADGPAFCRFFHPLVIAAGVIELRFGGFECRLCLCHIIFISIGFDHEDQISFFHFAACYQVRGLKITVYPGH